MEGWRKTFQAWLCWVGEASFSWENVKCDEMGYIVCLHGPAAADEDMCLG